MSASVVTPIPGSPAYRTWSGERDDAGHRTYHVGHVVQVTNPGLDGPLTVMNASGLPAIGAVWNFGSETDVWAFCWPTRTIRPHQEREGDPTEYWMVDSLFSTKPIPSKRCQDTPIEDPMLEPMKISGSFVKTTEEAVSDRFGNLLKSSSHERFKGPLVEFDSSRHTIRIEQNVLSLGLATFSNMVDCVNDAPLWGLPARCVKLSAPEWTRELYGSCSFYYKRIFTFDTNSATFDRAIPDTGTRVLNGHWSGAGYWVVDNIGTQTPDPNNPQHFIQYKDRNGENSTAILDGAGLPADVVFGSGSGTTGGTSGPGYIYTVEKYSEANFLLLGIPTTL